KREWKNIIREDVVLPDVREWIDRKKAPSYSTKLTLRDSSGLAMPSGMTPLVRTGAIKRFQRELSRMDSGAIGIARRRGAGESTLIERAMDNGFVPAFKPPPLTVMASSAARYVDRDFGLHLYAATCRAVINIVAASGGRAGADEANL